ncbi:MAG: metalloprotease-like protein [Pseudonocardiaceae bacterium]|nr:metalloprotease-like protein [Pseudonocardiaceae bacterium]
MTLARRLTVLLLAVAVLAGCTRTIAGQPVAGERLGGGSGGVVTRGDGETRGDMTTEDRVAPGPAGTSFIRGTDGSEIDQLAAAGLLDVQSYWRRNFEDTFGQPWPEITGGFHSVDTADPGAPSPPCVRQAGDIEGNAYYCPSADAIAWDRAALMPVLAEQFGDAAVVMVLAHEMGHAVHHRLGLDLARLQQQPEIYPTVLIESMADCYTGSFVRWVVDGNADYLDIDRDELDLALGALVTFRDPVGTSASDLAAHGNGFDRVSAFQDGYDFGPARCSAFSMSNRELTQERFTSISDAASGGDLPLDRLVNTLAPDLDAYFDRIVTQRGGRWQPPQLRPAERDPDCAGEQGPVAFCRDEATIRINGSGELGRLHAEVGDYTTGTLLATRYALAALEGLGRPVEGDDAGRTALCLAGSYSGDLLRRSEGFGLSPGDLDEAVQLLLALDYGALDARGEGRSTGFERVATFRTGTLDGLAGCGL